jgi:hypothetical protein
MVRGKRWKPESRTSTIKCLDGSGTEQFTPRAPTSTAGSREAELVNRRETQKMPHTVRGENNHHATITEGGQSVPSWDESRGVITAGCLACFPQDRLCICHHYIRRESPNKTAISRHEDCAKYRSFSRPSTLQPVNPSTRLLGTGHPCVFISHDYGLDR